MNKKTMTAVILTAALLFAIPVVLGEYAKSSDADSVTEVGDYDGLLSAIEEGEETGIEIKLMADLEDTGMISIASKTITIDCNSKTITFKKSEGSEDAYLEISGSSNVTIKNGIINSENATAIKLEGTAKLISENMEIDAKGEAFRVVGGSDSTEARAEFNPELTISNGTVQSGEDCCVFIYGKATLNIIDDASLLSSGVYATIQGNGNLENSGTTINLIDCEVKQNKEEAVAIYVPQCHDMLIKNSSIEGAMGIYIKSGNITIEDTTINGTGAEQEYSYDGNGCKSTGDAIVIDACDYPGGNPKIEIINGNFSSENAAAIAYYVPESKTKGASAAYEFTVRGEFSGAVHSDVFVKGDNETITMELYGDLAETLYNKGFEVHLNLNGHVISGNTASVAAITNDGTFFLSDSVGTGVVKRNDVGSPAYYVILNRGMMTIEGGNVTNKSGSVEEWGGASLICNIGSSDDEKATLIINDGTFQQRNFIVIKNDEYSILEVNGGIITTAGDGDGNPGAQAIQNWGDATLAGGTITGRISNWVYNFGDDSGSELESRMEIKDNVVIEGILVMRNHNAISAKPTVTISGGTFNGTLDVKYGTLYVKSSIVIDGESVLKDADVKINSGGNIYILSGGSIQGIIEAAEGSEDEYVNIVTVGPNGKVVLSAISDGDPTIRAEGCSDVKYSIVPNSGYRYSGTGTLVDHGTLGNVSFSAVPPVDPVPPAGPDVDETVKTDGTHTETTKTTTDPDGTVTVETSITDSATGVTTSASTGSAIETTIPSTASASVDGTAGVVIDGAAVEAAIKQIAMAAEATGTESAPVIRIAVETDGAATGLSVEIPASSLRDLADMGATVTVSSGTAVVTLDPDAASTIGSAGEGEVRIGIGEASKDDLSAAQKDVVGDKMVIRIDATAGDNSVHQLNGKATLSVPYTLKPGEDPDDIVIWYINDNGRIENIAATYADGFVTWETDHFSFYAVAFELGVNPSDSDMTLVYVAAVAIAIAVIAVIAYVIWKRSASA